MFLRVVNVNGTVGECLSGSDDETGNVGNPTKGNAHLLTLWRDGDRNNPIDFLVPFVLCFGILVRVHWSSKYANNFAVLVIPLVTHDDMY